MYLLDPLYLLMLVITIALTGAAQLYVKSTYKRYAQVQTTRGRTGAEVARSLLDRDGLGDVGLEETPGRLSDHYDPRSRVLRLSPEVSRGRSLSSVGVAAHEAGHAMQDAASYTPFAIRSAIVPAASIGSSLAIPLIFIGLFTRFSGLITLGIIFFSAAVIFQLVTLPVEFNASRRAVAALTATGEIVPAEESPVRSVLRAAALTYVAAALVAVIQLVYFVMLGGRRN